MIDGSTAALIIVAILITIIVIWEIAIPSAVKESFGDYIAPVSIKSFYGQLVPARGDVGDHDEEEGYRADPRYFHGYSEVQRMGLNKDYCRMVEPVGGNEDDAFFACALAGTEGLSSTSYRTKTIRDGFRRSRDDYMNDIHNEGRSGYCSIIKIGNTFQPRCYRAYDTKFADSHVIDPSPPDATKMLLSFYDGILMWYRLRDDVVDYAQNTFASITGGLQIDEKPVPITRGMSFNGIDQYIRLGESSDLALGQKVALRFARAFSVWVKFDEFTNNARIFDFGNGAGKDNVILGIIGKGNYTTATSNDNQATNTIPCGPSGPQDSEEVRPQTLMLTTAANIDKYVCRKPEVMGREMEPIALGCQNNETAHLFYEIWDGPQRIMRCIVPSAIKCGKWIHVAITTTNINALRPDIAIYVDGVKKYTQADGHLPQASYMTHNYIGKSNWASDTDNDENADQLFKGSLFDFRIYSKSMSETKIKNTIAWGKELLGLP
jgi:hypothetical protein